MPEKTMIEYVRVRLDYVKECLEMESELEKELRLAREQNARLEAENELLRGMMRREKA